MIIWQRRQRVLLTSEGMELTYSPAKLVGVCLLEIPGTQWVMMGSGFHRQLMSVEHAEKSDVRRLRSMHVNLLNLVAKLAGNLAFCGFLGTCEACFMFSEMHW